MHSMAGYVKSLMSDDGEAYVQSRRELCGPKTGKGDRLGRKAP